MYMYIVCTVLNSIELKLIENNRNRTVTAPTCFEMFGNIQDHCTYFES